MGVMPKPRPLAKICRLSLDALDDEKWLFGSGELWREL
jgi:hypothetical protein